MRCHPVTSPALLAMGRGWGSLSPSTAAAGADSSPSAARCSPEATAEGHRKGDSLFGSSLHRIWEEKENPWRKSFQSLKGCREEPGGDSTSYGTDPREDGQPWGSRVGLVQSWGAGRQGHSSYTPGLPCRGLWWRGASPARHAAP